MNKEKFNDALNKQSKQKQEAYRTKHKAMDYNQTLPTESNMEYISEERVQIPYTVTTMIHKKSITSDSKIAEFQIIAKNSVILPKAYIKHSTCITKVANGIEISIKELVDFYSKETAVESSYSIQWVYVLLQGKALWKYYDFTRGEIDRARGGEERLRGT